MINAIMAVLVLATILLVSEIAWKKAKIRDEIARKFVHISTGVFISFLPFWVEYKWIIVIAIGLIVGNIINRYISVFHAIHTVRRKSWGDVLMGVGVLILALFQPSPWIFTVSMLQVSLADGLAALIGVSFARDKGKYYLFAQPKSFIGSFTFLVSSIAILAVGIIFSRYFVGLATAWPLLVMLPIMLVCVENISVFGTDNLTLPLFTLFVLSLF